MRKEQLAPISDQPQVESPPTIAPSGITLRACIMAFILTIITGMWVRQSEILVLATQVTESIPTIPALTALSLLLIGNLFVRRYTRLRPFTSPELMMVFIFVAISSCIMGIGIIQFLIGIITSTLYYTTENAGTLHAYLPKWLVPQDKELIHQLYEGGINGRVPWEIWWKPIIGWLGFFVALWLTLYCLMALFYRAWAQDERLAFPLVSLPMEMTEEDGRRSFFKSPIMWAGFSISAIYNLVNIIHAFYPSLPAFGKEFTLGTTLVNRPWSEFNDLSIHFRPELIGLGWLVSTEISLTIWIGFFINRFLAVFASAAGYIPYQLYPMEQGIGAFLMLACVLIWTARGRLLKAWKAASSSNDAEGVSQRGALIGLIIGFGLIWTFATQAGIAYWVAFSYLAVVLAVALVYGRLRAQTGVPMIWLFPYHMQKAIFFYTFGSAPFAAAGPKTMATWAMFTFLARGYFPTLTGYQVEAMEMNRRTGTSGKRLFPFLMAAVVMGVLLGFYHHLVPYYQHGAIHLRDGSIWGNWVSVPEYQQAASMLNTHTNPSFEKIICTFGGASVTAFLSLLRLRFATFPLSPLGYAMTSCFGSVLWGPFLVVWIAKTAVLRYGGMRLYRRSIPFFLGFALGHFAVAGIFWGILGAFNKEATSGYPVFFG